MTECFTFEDENQVPVTVDWGTPGLSVTLDSLGIMSQVVPATALGYFNGSVIAGHDTSFEVAALQANGTTPFNLTGIPISVYGKVYPSDTILVFSKTLAGNPVDVLVPTPTNGLIDIFIRAADYAAIAVGTTIFIYVDAIDAIGNPINIAKWTLTITN
jgi:hypothetical protein